MCLFALPTTSGNAPDRRSLGNFLSDLDWFISQFLHSLVLCRGAATIHDVPEVLDCLHHPGTAATLQPHEAEHGYAKEEPRAHCTSLTRSHSGTFD